LQLQILNTTVSIHEHSLRSPHKSSSSDPAAQLQELENLWTCLTAVKSWFNNFYSLEVFPLSNYPHFSMAILSQMAHCLVALFRLSTFESPNIPWDHQRIRSEELDLGEILAIMVDRWEKVPQAAGIETCPQRVGERDEQWAGDPWSHARKRIQGIKDWWQARVTATRGMDTPENTRAEDNGAMDELGLQGQQMEAMELGAMNMETLDDMWIRGLLGGGYDINWDP
jgi:hypothetical protein